MINCFLTFACQLFYLPFSFFGTSKEKKGKGKEIKSKPTLVLLVKTLAGTSILGLNSVLFWFVIFQVVNYNKNSLVSEIMTYLNTIIMGKTSRLNFFFFQLSIFVTVNPDLVDIFFFIFAYWDGVIHRYHLSFQRLKQFNGTNYFLKIIYDIKLSWDSWPC